MPDKLDLSSCGLRLRPDISRHSEGADREYEIDVAMYQEEFAKVNSRDPAQLREWFVAHPYLANNDLARIANVSLKSIQRSKQAAGQPRMQRQPPLSWSCYQQVLHAPSHWKEGTWLEEQYQAAYSIHTIARAIGRSYTATRQLLQRRGVVFRSARRAVRSRHPCCTHRWATQHYLHDRLSLTGCARLAQVSSSTMTAWLLRFHIRIRSSAEQQALEWARRRRLASVSGKLIGSPTESGDCWCPNQTLPHTM